MNVDSIDTPAVVVDLDRLERNILKLQSYLDEHGVANRPHIKTHKVPEIAHRQMSAGAVGICCQKLGEAEVMAAAGIRDIFIPYNIIGEAKLERLAQLMTRAELRVAVDSRFTVDGLSRAASRAGRTLSVLVEVDTGAGRCGVQSPAEAEELALYVDRAAGLRLAGLMAYPLTEQTDPFVIETRRRLEAHGLEIETVSAGGTHCMWRVHEHPVVTEHRAGMYIYGDRKTLLSGAMSLEDCAIRVVTTVVSRPNESRAILDAGSKSLAADQLGLEGHGLILEYPDAVIRTLSEEHGHVDVSACKRRPDIGERVSVLPNHCCPVSNLFDAVYGVRNGVVETVFQVAARGRVT